MVTYKKSLLTPVLAREMIALGLNMQLYGIAWSELLELITSCTTESDSTHANNIYL